MSIKDRFLSDVNDLLHPIEKIIEDATDAVRAELATLRSDLESRLTILEVATGVKAAVTPAETENK